MQIMHLQGIPLKQDVFHLSLPDFINSSEQLTLKKMPAGSQIFQ